MKRLIEAGAFLLPIFVLIGTDKVVYIVNKLVSSGPKLSPSFYSSITRCNIILTDISRWADTIAIAYLALVVLLFVYAVRELDMDRFEETLGWKGMLILGLATVLVAAFLIWKLYVILMGEHCIFLPAYGRRQVTYISMISPLLREVTVWLSAFLYWVIMAIIMSTLTFRRLFS